MNEADDLVERNERSRRLMVVFLGDRVERIEEGAGGGGVGQSESQ